LIGLYF